MNNRWQNSFLAIAFLWLSCYLLNAQKDTNFLVHFPDLKFHSAFEKKSIQNYVLYNKDTFNLFLAIDPSVNEHKAKELKKRYQAIQNQLYLKKVPAKKLKGRIRRTFSLVHNKYLKRYVDVEYFPTLLQNGKYNCVTSSIIYSLLFSELAIPYKLKATRSHVYLVANPGRHSIVVETTNPKLQRTDEMYDIKKQYVNYLKSKKIVTEKDIENKSINEIFEEKSSGGKRAYFDNLIGFQYYNRSLKENEDGDFKLAYELAQKAYFFYPSEQVKILMYGLLMKLILSRDYNHVNDVDYIANLTRYNTLPKERINEIFQEILNYHLQFTNHKALCDSMHTRLVSQITDAELRQELSFNFYLRMSQHYVNTDFQKEYIEHAVSIKQNHVVTNESFKGYMERELRKIEGYKNTLKKIDEFREKYNYDFVIDFLKEQELLAHLNQAYDLLKYNYIEEGEEYLSIFEDMVQKPVETENKKLIRAIETAYRTIAVFYFYRDDRRKAVETIERGLQYVPGSRFLQTAVY